MTISILLFVVLLGSLTSTTTSLSPQVIIGFPAANIAKEGLLPNHAPTTFTPVVAAHPIGVPPFDPIDPLLSYTATAEDGPRDGRRLAATDWCNQGNSNRTSGHH